jgi:hypothetical protein
MLIFTIDNRSESQQSRTVVRGRELSFIVIACRGLSRDSEQLRVVTTVDAGSTVRVRIRGY